SIADHASRLGIDDRVWWTGHLPDDLLPAHPSRRIARSTSSPPPHAGVGIFVERTVAKQWPLVSATGGLPRHPRRLGRWFGGPRRHRVAVASSLVRRSSKAFVAIART